MLRVPIRLRDDLYVVRHEVHRVEAHAELSDQVQIAALLHLFQER